MGKKIKFNLALLWMILLNVAGVIGISYGFSIFIKRFIHNGTVLWVLALMACLVITAFAIKNTSYLRQ